MKESLIGKLMGWGGFDWGIVGFDEEMMESQTRNETTREKFGVEVLRFQGDSGRIVGVF
jgi:hypothetical protein